MSASRKPCRYPTGQCPRGDGCMFHHDPQTTRGLRTGTRSASLPLGDPTATKSITKATEKNERPLCKYFATGSCIYGNSCRHSHAADLSKVTTINVKPQTTKGTQGGANEGPLCKYYTTGSCIYGNSCRQRHGVSDDTRSPVCKFFRSGGCKHGAACRFSHGTDDEIAPALAVNIDSPRAVTSFI